ncbi:hypothetical protein FGO68_gene7816 [Halteria grandinella]|uniref:Uncharacterized protein n=1 Tax=Halteria grandinella TaxID=5974 RepID=A0A8J8P274_HALGN|nr:hypothetical protein FGO68_gene7816 [Halteria grandinella]
MGKFNQSSLTANHLSKITRPSLLLVSTTLLDCLLSQSQIYPLEFKEKVHLLILLERHRFSFDSERVAKEASIQTDSKREISCLLVKQIIELPFAQLDQQT